MSRKLLCGVANLSDGQHTLNFAVLGSPIAHSLSPRLHAAAFAIRGLPHSYDAHRVEQLASWIETNPNFAGLSITMPLKEQALAIADQLDEASLATGSVNTLTRTAHGWSGANTDVEGIKFALAGADLSRVIVVGSGATARSALFAMRAVPALGVVARNRTAAKELAERYRAEVCEIADLAAATVISTLPPSALIQFIDRELRPTGVLLDIAYYPWPSLAAERWIQTGSAISGVEMLIGQAVAQQRLFDTEALDERAVLRAMRSAIGMKE